MRGEFIRGDGLVIPNNVTLAGASAILAAAFQGAGLTLWAGLIQGTPGVNVQVQDIVEPTATNGYGRIEILDTDTAWPVITNSNNEMYVESDWIEWTATGGPFSVAIQRIAFFGAEVDAGPTDSVMMMSTLMPAEIVIDEDTPQAERRFKYRFYL